MRQWIRLILRGAMWGIAPYGKCRVVGDGVLDVPAVCAKGMLIPGEYRRHANLL
ncbi:MAG: hypothetical protein IJI27_04440 [Oscillospiraceae bacterium]|nr:hypothetical protein [Oscillospiraceae bacterium]